MHPPIIPHVSLCTGYDGIGLGLARVVPNLVTIGYCEREVFAVSGLVAKIEAGLLDAAPVFPCVSAFPWLDYAPVMAGGILSFGWPCQPVSCAGKRKATEDERWLFDIIADGIVHMRPGIIFAENVEGLLSAKMPDGSSVFGHCISRLEGLHYKIAAGLFSASEVGAPHQRKRVFILGLADDLGEQGQELGRQIAAWAQQRAVGDDGGDAWPSRPGEPQHGWEPPRTVGGGMALDTGVGKQVLDQQFGPGEVDGTRQGEDHDAADQRHGLSAGEFPPRGETEEGDRPYSGGTSVHGAAPIRHGDQSQGRKQAEQHAAESGVCDGSGEQSARSGHGVELCGRRDESDGETDSGAGCGDTHSGRITEGDCDAVRRSSGDDFGHSFWQEVEAAESAGSGPVADAIDQREQQRGGVVGEVGGRSLDEGEGVGDPSGRGCGVGGDAARPERGGHVDGADEAVGDSRGHGGWQDEPGREAEGGTAADRSGAGGDMADAEDGDRGRGERGEEAGTRSGEQRRGRFASGSSAILADASGGHGGELPRPDVGPVPARDGQEHGNYERETFATLGRDFNGNAAWVGLSECSGLSDPELAEIHRWMVAHDNRTDELRLLGNGCIPATVELAFRTLLGELCEQ